MVGLPSLVNPTYGLPEKVRVEAVCLSLHPAFLFRYIFTVVREIEGSDPPAGEENVYFTVLIPPKK